MVEQFKSNILKYLIGKMDIELGNNEPQINQILEMNNDLDSFIRLYYPKLSSIWNISNIVTRGDNIIVWVNDYNDDINDSSYGKWKKTLVIVMDKDYKPFEYIDTYDSGTNLCELYLVDSEDNGFGNIIGIEILRDSDGNVKNRRISIINDFTLIDFKIRLLNSWNIPKKDGYDVFISQITKNPQQGKYFLTYNYEDNIKQYGGVLEFVNNVGADNEWNFYQYIGDKDINWGTDIKGIPNWDNDVFRFRIFLEYTIEEDDRGNSIAFVVLKEFIDKDIKSAVEEHNFNLPSSCKNVGQMIETEIIGSNALIVTQTTSSNKANTKYVIQFNMNNGTYSIRYAKENYYDVILQGEGNYESSNDIIKILKINNQFYFLRHYEYSRKENYQTVKYYDNKMYLHQIFQNKVFEFFIKDFGQKTEYNYKIFVSNSYNLYEFSIILSSYVINAKQVFNQLSYNGLPYSNVDAMVPYSAIILDKDGIIIFARNLYNKIINGNMMQASIEVPNSLLNNKNIFKKILLSKTNNMLVEDIRIINKNIYEKLLINFYNTLNIVNKNNSKEIINTNGATRLNRSINFTNDYDDTRLSKCRIISKENDIIVKNIQIDLANEWISGTSLPLENCTEESLMELSIVGKSYQQVTEASKNICPSSFNDWESGDYSMANGSKEVSNSRLRLKELVRVESNQSYYVNTFSNNIAKFIFRTFDNDKKFVRSLGGTRDTSKITILANEKFISVSMYNETLGIKMTYDDFKKYFENKQILPFLCLDSETDKSFIEFVPDSPSPQYLKEIESISKDGKVSLSIHTKNLLNVSRQYTVTGNNTITIDLSVGAYTVSWKNIETNGKNNAMLLYFYYEDGTTLAKYISNSYQSKSLRFSITKQVEKVGIYSQSSWNESQGITTTFEELMLEKNDEKTDYAEYQQQTIEIDLKDNELCSLPNGVANTLYLKDNHLYLEKRIRKFVFDNKDKYSVIKSNSNVENYNCFIIKIKDVDKRPKKGIVQAPLSNFAKGTDKSTYTIFKNEINQWGDTSADFCMNLSDVPSEPADFKEYLQGKNNTGTPFYILYEMQNTEIIDLGECTIYTIKDECYIELIDTLETDLKANYFVNEDYCTLSETLYVDKPLKSLEFISNDEKTIYNTIDLTKLKIGKYYVIKQKVEVK